MNAKNSVGFFGKLPAHGDFVYRELPNNFISVWDEWLQNFVGSTKEQIGETWLDTYLTSPIWRFAFSAGVVDQNVWAGIMLPSVDRVGRYFPFTVATVLPGHQNPFHLIDQCEWYENIEDAALKALNGEVTIEELIPLLNSTTFKSSLVYHPSPINGNGNATLIKMDLEEQKTHSVMGYLLNAAVKDSLASVSVWNTRGSELVEPCVFYARGLPPMRGVAAMLDGQWDDVNWHQPYTTS